MDGGAIFPCLPGAEKYMLEQSSVLSFRVLDAATPDDHELDKNIIFVRGEKDLVRLFKGFPN